MHSRSDESGEYGCGYCTSPSCIYNEISGGGHCPFYDRKIGYSGEEIREKVRKTADIPRGSPMLQEVSPCTESGMYTIEGILRDPEEFDKSAVFDPEALGILLEAAPFKKMKWSPQLGYGMGHREDGSRVHLHSRGKIIIRKAPGREEADRMFYLLTSLARPALFSIKGGFSLWEALFMEYHGQDRRTAFDYGPYLIWGQKEGDAGEIADSTRIAYRDLDERIGDELRSQIVEMLEDMLGSEADPEQANILKKRLTGTWKDLELRGYEGSGQALGTRVFFLSAIRSVRGLGRFMGDGLKMDAKILRDLTARIVGSWTPGRSEISLEGLDIDLLDSARGLMQCAFFLMPFGRSIKVSLDRI